jgi:hypothetical protein
MEGFVDHVESSSNGGAVRLCVKTQQLLTSLLTYVARNPTCREKALAESPHCRESLARMRLLPNIRTYPKGTPNFTQDQCLKG